MGAPTIPPPPVQGMSSQTFDYNHPGPSEGQLEVKAYLASMFGAILTEIQSIVPGGRYRAAAITLLEQANFLCTRGVFHNNDGSFRIESDEPATRTGD